MSAALEALLAALAGSPEIRNRAEAQRLATQYRSEVLAEAADVAHCEGDRLYDDTGQKAAEAAWGVSDLLRSLAAAGQAPAPQPEPPVYGDGFNRVYCHGCRPANHIPLAWRDIAPGEVCATCRRDLVDAAKARSRKLDAAPQPVTAPDPLAYGPRGYRCGCGKNAHSNLVPCAEDGPSAEPTRELHERIMRALLEADTYALLEKRTDRERFAAAVLDALGKDTGDRDQRPAGESTQPDAALLAHVAALESLAADATEYRLMPPGYGRTPVVVRRDPAYDGTAWAVIHDPGDRAVRRAWTRSGWEMTAVLAHGELFCWPTAETAIAEARTALTMPGAGQGGAQ